MKKNKNRYKKKTKGIKFYKHGRYIIKNKYFETKGTIIHLVRPMVKDDLVLTETLLITHCLMIDLQKSRSFKKLIKAHGRRLNWF